MLRNLQDISLEGFLLTPVQKICKYPLQLSVSGRREWEGKGKGEEEDVMVLINDLRSKFLTS